jgi:hypothetical protein
MRPDGERRSARKACREIEAGRLGGPESSAPFDRGRGRERGLRRSARCRIVHARHGRTSMPARIAHVAGVPPNRLAAATHAHT